MGLGKSSIDYILRAHGISQRMKDVTMDNIIPIFPIESLDNDRYPGVKRRYLTEDPELVNYNLLDLSSILSSKETRQQALGLASLSPTTTVK